MRGWEMSEWKNGCLADLAVVKAGYSFRSSEFTDTGRRLIKISNIQKSNVCVQENDVFICNNPSYEDFELQENEVLIALSGATTGKVGKVKKDVLPAYLNQRVGKYEANAGGCIDFIY